jgi:hypothetical protein
MGAGGESGTISVKASREDRAELIAAGPQELRQVVTEAWRRTAPKRVVRAYDSAHG